MLIITKYFTREFLKIFFLCLAAFITLYLLVDLFEKLDDIIKHSTPLLSVAKYFVFSIPLIIYQICPLGVLLCTFITIGLFVRNNEITALKAHGISLFMVFKIFVLLAAFQCLFSLLLQEYVLPYTNRKMKEIKNVQIKGKKSKRLRTMEHFWYRSDNTMFNIEFFDPSKNILQGITIYSFSPDFLLQKRIDAQKAVWSNGEWTLQNGIIRIFKSNSDMVVSQFDALKVAIHETPEDFKMSQKESEEMSLSEIRAFIKKISREGYDTTPYRADMHAKVSYPFISIIMAILGIPFAMNIGRSGGMALGVALSIFFGFIYWIFYAFCISLGKGGTLTPFLSAWIANIAFGILGTYMFLRVRQ